MKRKRTEAEWQELAEEQWKSGLTQKAWCAESGVNYGTFTSHARRIRKVGGRDADSAEGAEGLKKGWVEIVPAGQAAELNASGKIEVSVGVYRITVRADFEEAPFKRVCKALSELC